MLLFSVHYFPSYRFFLSFFSFVSFSLIFLFFYFISFSYNYLFLIIFISFSLPFCFLFLFLILYEFYLLTLSLSFLLSVYAYITSLSVLTHTHTCPAICDSSENLHFAPSYTISSSIIIQEKKNISLSLLHFPARQDSLFQQDIERKSMREREENGVSKNVFDFAALKRWRRLLGLAPG